MPLTPPERLVDDVVVLRRSVLADADAVAAAAGSCLEHLAQWMPWATPEGVSPAAQRERLGATRWDPSSDYDYLMLDPVTEAVIGGCSLMRRRGPGVLEIGYWVHADHTRRGVATRSAGLLTVAGATVEGTRELQIHCDEANRASAAIPPKLGYRLDRVVDTPREAPAATGRTMVWVRPA